MKNSIIKWGSISGLFLIISFLLSAQLTTTDNPNYELGEVVGFSLIFLSLGCIFLGIKSYRDKNSGALSFGAALKIGTLISLFPAIAFVIYNWIYVTYLDPEFTETYYAHQLDKARTTMNAEDYAAYEVTTAAEKEMFTSPVMQALVYFFTNFLLGFVVSIIAALIMKRKFKSSVTVT